VTTPTTARNKTCKINNVTNNGGIILIDGELKGEKNVNNFQVATIGADNFSIAYKYKGSAYNIVISVK